MVCYSSMGEPPKTLIPIWEKDARKVTTKEQHYNCCLVSVILAFAIGLSVGLFVPYLHVKTTFVNTNSSEDTVTITSAEVKDYPTVSFVDKFVGSAPTNSGVIEDGIYWSRNVERALPQGYSGIAHETWSSYVRNGVAVKLEKGCGRMQNRLITFQDGSQGCARYRQNTDQIQGELFSFYLAQVLKIPNLAPSTVSVVNLNTPLFQNIASEVTAAQWSSNRPIVLTKYLPNLDASNIPKIFRPNERHLNKNDVQNLTTQNTNSLKTLVELAQWSDLIIFDYLTANLDRIVNNLYNYQWNSNIMEAPAHNLARSSDSDLLVFLDNESGLLHGYRLLEKYETYHAVLLDNLCIFRRRTAEAVRRLRRDGDVGRLLRAMFDVANGGKVREVLPTLPDKSVKILNSRIERVDAQIAKCEAMFGR